MSREAEHGIRSAVKLTTGRFAAQLILLVSALVIPRFMGAESYGRYVAWMAMIAILRSATSLGLPMIEVRFLAPLWRLGRRAEALTLGSTIWTSKLVLSVAGGIAVVVWMVLSPELSPGMGVAGTLGLLACLNYVHEGAISLYLPLGRVGTLSSFLMARALLTLIVVLAAYSWAGLAGVAWGLVALYAALSAASWTCLLRMAPLTPTRFRWPSLSQHIPFSLAVYVGTVAWMVQGQFSIYAVANWAATEQAAYLGLTLHFYGFLQLLFLSAKRALTPVLSQIETQGQRQRLRRWGDVMMRYSIAASCVLVLGWTFLGRDVIRLVLTDAFLPVYKSATLILVCVLFYCCAESCAILLYVRGRARVASANLVVYALVTIAGVFLALRGPETGTVHRVSYAYAAAAVLYGVSSYVALGVFGGLWLPLRRSLLLALPAAAAAAVLWETSFAVRLPVLVGLMASYAGLAVGLGLLPFGELSKILAKALGGRRGSNETQQQPKT